MHILAQHGFNAGERINRGLAEGLIDGVIYGAKDIAPERLSEQCALHASEHPESLRLFDPQYYACLASAEPGVRLGHLSGRTPHSYFAPRLRRQLEQEHQVIADIGACLRYQCALPVSALVVPNVVIRHSLDSVDASIAKEFVRQARGQQTAIGDSRPLYATLAISIDAIRDRIRLQNFLQEVTEIEDPPDGFYVLIEHPAHDIPPTLEESGILSKWMLVNHVFVQSGFEVINGYSDLLTPYLGAAGATATAGGWFNTLKVFSLKKFAPAVGMARQPVPRYSSKHLLKSVRHTELEVLRDVFPSVLNGSATDNDYDPDDGSRPTSIGEALQNWDCMRSLADLVTAGDPEASIQNLSQALSEAEETYDEIGASGIALRERSNNEHIESLQAELAAFRTLAEL